MMAYALLLQRSIKRTESSWGNGHVRLTLCCPLFFVEFGAKLGLLERPPNRVSRKTRAKSRGNKRKATGGSLDTMHCCNLWWFLNYARNAAMSPLPHVKHSEELVVKRKRGGVPGVSELPAKHKLFGDGPPNEKKKNTVAEWLLKTLLSILYSTET